MTRFFVQHPVTTWMIFSAFIVLALYALPKIEVEALPEIDLPSLSVNTAWNGASPQAIQQSITLPIEEAARGLSDVENVVSTSRGGSSTVRIELNRDASIDFARLELNEALINWLNVGDNVALPLRENTDLGEDEIRAQVEEKLEWVSLPGIWDKLPSELSGGMRKRVGLARALITEPEIILYDEPNAGLDPEISNSINVLIRDLSDRLPITSVVITHLLSCVRTVADRVVLLEHGKVQFEGTRDEFLHTDHERVRSFLGADPD